MIKFTESELERIAEGNDPVWEKIDQVDSDESTTVIFNSRNGESPFYAFDISGEEISDAYSVFPKKMITIVWEKVYND